MKRNRRPLLRNCAKDTQVYSSNPPFHLSSRWLISYCAEEFNKYLSYVRNLGFEDTPDYDYLRDLFTQVLKNAGEVEDGEYDWMKLNNGRGWEAVKSYPPQHHLHGSNAVPNTSARELHGAAPGRVQRPGVTADRLNAAQPPPPSPAKPGVGKARERPNASGGPQVKRQNGAAGGLEATPAASTHAQFQNSNAHLPGRVSSPGNTGMHAQQQTQSNMRTPPEPEPTFMQKVMKALCCGKLHRSHPNGFSHHFD